LSTPVDGGLSTVDIGSILDEGEWGGYQKLLVCATALTIILDGLDNQVLGAAVPVLARDWSLPASAFRYVLTSGMVGMMIGGLVGGFAGDRMGRRVALIGSVLAFGLLTLVVALSNGVWSLGLLRFLAGLGLGGAMPNAAALSSEYVPRRHRPFAVTLTIVCIPLGGSLAGLTAGSILPRFGWPALFVVVGIVPLALAVLLFMLLPESPRYLARHRERWAELSVLLRRLGHDLPADAAFVDPAEQGLRRASVREVLVPEFRHDTLALCASFFFCLLSVYMGTNWVPTMLRSAHFDVGTASYGLTAFNFGGVVGAILGAFFIVRRGSRLTMLSMAVGAVGGAVLLGVMPIGPQSTLLVFALLAWTGGLINAVQTTMYALAAHVYPTSIRATGVGTAVGFGRIGGVLSPSLGAWALDSGHAPRYFGLIATTMTLALASLAAVRDHIPAMVNLQRRPSTVEGRQPSSVVQ
jgi:AAHS family 4-hydroxybenzoate transporter-like MFS transporter